MKVTGLSSKLLALMLGLNGLTYGASHSHDGSNPIVRDNAVWKKVLVATDMPVAPPLTPQAFPTVGANWGLQGEGISSDRHGNLYFVDTTATAFVPSPGPNAGAPNLALNPNGIVWYYNTKTGETERFLQPSGMASGTKVDKKGRLLVVSGADFLGFRQVRRYNVKTKEFEILAADYPAGSGNKLVSPNDVTIDRKGRIYFVDSRHQGTNSGVNTWNLPFAVYRIDTDGSLHQIITNLAKPNGVEISPDGKYLYVGDDFTGVPNSFSPLAAQGFDAFGYRLGTSPTAGLLGGAVIKYRLNKKGEIVDKQGNVSPENSNVTVGKALIRRDNVIPDGMALDTEGNIYTAWQNGGFPGAGPINGWVGEINVITSKGKLLANLTPQLASIPPIAGIPNVVITPNNQALNFRSTNLGFGLGKHNRHILYMNR
jgi:sugar lactone lactonase YvrE